LCVHFQIHRFVNFMIRRHVHSRCRESAGIFSDNEPDAERKPVEIPESLGMF
jgi:hypothetical protein